MFVIGQRRPLAPWLTLLTVAGVVGFAAAFVRRYVGGRDRIRGRALRFVYPGVREGDDALAGMSLSIAPGETVALVGETGAGKSTIVKLIARFYDPTSGVVTVDVRRFDLGEYRRRLGVVPQEAFLFTGTARDNIAYGRPSATDADVEAAARGVGVHDFVASLPGGYLATVSERGRSLSAGQRQLIALARAPRRPRDPPARRGDVEPRSRDRGARPAGDGRASGGTHGAIQLHRCRRGHVERAPR